MKKITKKIIILLFATIFLSCEKLTDNEILRFYGDVFEDIGYSVAKTGNGYVITGQHEVVTRTDDNYITGRSKKLILLETGLNGVEIRKSIADLQMESSGTKVITLEDGAYVVAGSIFDDVKKQRHLYVIKFAPGGEGYDDKVFSELEGNVYARDIIKTPDGFLVLATTDKERGSSDDTGNQRGKKDVLLVSLTNSLEVIRSIPYGFTGDDEGVALKANPGVGYVIVGTTDRYSATSGTDIFILAVNEDISNVSATSGRFLEVEDDQTAADFEVTGDGYFIAGNNTTKTGVRSGYVCKIAGSIWGPKEDQLIKLNGEFSVNAACRYKTNSFLLAGQYGSMTSGSMLVFVTDMLGNPVEGKLRIAGGTGNQIVYDVIADGEDIIAVGKNSYENNSMITLLKFRF